MMPERAPPGYYDYGRFRYPSGYGYPLTGYGYESCAYCRGRYPAYESVQLPRTLPEPVEVSTFTTTTKSAAPIAKETVSTGKAATKTEYLTDRYGPEHCHSHHGGSSYFGDKKYVDRGYVVEERAYAAPPPKTTTVESPTGKFREGYVIAEMPGGKIIETPVSKEKTAYEKDIESRIHTYSKKKTYKPYEDTFMPESKAATMTTTTPVTTKTVPLTKGEVIETTTTTTTTAAGAPITTRAV